jgi:hypothetical protein
VLRRVLLSLGVYDIPTLAIVTIEILLSTATRTARRSVVGSLLFVLLLNLRHHPGLEGLAPYVLPHTG